MHEFGVDYSLDFGVNIWDEKEQRARRHLSYRLFLESKDATKENINRLKAEVLKTYKLMKEDIEYHIFNNTLQKKLIEIKKRIEELKEPDIMKLAKEQRIRKEDEQIDKDDRSRDASFGIRN